MNLDEYLKRHINRRQFLGSSAIGAAGMVTLAGTAHASPSEKISLGVIGVRGQGKTLAASFAKLADCRVAAVCDVDAAVLPAAVNAVEEGQGTAPRVERDFRRLLDDRSIDAVVIATPDHWHAPMTLLACEAGKDVYVEKPVSHNIREGERMVVAARKHQRVVQSGLQQRSGSHFQSAIEFVRSGRLGEVRLAKAWTVHKRKSIGLRSDGPAPEGVHYEQWLGPAASRNFNPNRFHYHWRWFWDYGSGELGNWGVHMLDVARWGLGVELPTRVTSSGGKLHFRDDQETPDTQFVTFDFAAPGAASQAAASQGAASQSVPADGAGEPRRTITWEHCLWSNHGPDGRSAAAAFYGEHGTLIVDRGGWKVYDLSETIVSGPSDSATAHHRNFLDSIRARTLPAADIAVGHVSSALCHLGNIAHRLGRSVTFDSATMSCGSDAEGNAMLGSV